MRLEADELAALLRAHAFLTVERPPNLEALETTTLQSFVRMLGEMIAAALARNGNELSGVVLSVATVSVEPSAAGAIPAGTFVAVSVRGAGTWTDATWPGGRLLSEHLTTAVVDAGAVAAYTRNLAANEDEPRGAVTALFTRAR